MLVSGWEAREYKDYCVIFCFFFKKKIIIIKFLFDSHTANNINYLKFPLYILRNISPLRNTNKVSLNFISVHITRYA